MPRKESITKAEIRKAAFELTKKSGVQEVTARKLATFAGCSTQPIFRNYENMEECLNDVFEDSLKFFDDFYTSFDKSSHVPFVNLGMAFISFAENEPFLFSYLFMSKNEKGYNLYSILNSRTGCVIKEMNACREDGVSNPETIFMKMWMLIHGAACMTITGDYDLSKAQTRLQLEEAYKAFVR